MLDQLNARLFDQVFASGKLDPTLAFAGHRSRAQQGAEGHIGQTEAIDDLFTRFDLDGLD
jgi:hypothetical protein